MGECAMCGECCRWAAARVFKLPTKDDLRWMEYHGIKLVGRVMFIPCKCTHLTEEGLCDIYESRPQCCKDFPNEESKDLQPLGCKAV